MSWDPRRKNLDGLRPACQAHVRWREHGAPLRSGDNRNGGFSSCLRLLGAAKGRPFHLTVGGEANAELMKTFPALIDPSLNLPRGESFA
jgi:hypothetical protein